MILGATIADLTLLPTLDGYEIRRKKNKLFITHHHRNNTFRDDKSEVCRGMDPKSINIADPKLDLEKKKDVRRV